MVPSDSLARISPTGSVPCSAPGQAEALDGQRFLESLPDGRPPPQGGRALATWPVCSSTRAARSAESRFYASRNALRTEACSRSDRWPRTFLHLMDGTAATSLCSEPSRPPASAPRVTSITGGSLGGLRFVEPAVVSAQVALGGRVGKRREWSSVRTPCFVREARFCWAKVGRTASSYSFPCAIRAWIESDQTGRSDRLRAPVRGPRSNHSPAVAKASRGGILPRMHPGRRPRRSLPLHRRLGAVASGGASPLAAT